MSHTTSFEDQLLQPGDLSELAVNLTPLPEEEEEVDWQLEGSGNSKKLVEMLDNIAHQSVDSCSSYDNVFDSKSEHSITAILSVHLYQSPPQLKLSDLGPPPSWPQMASTPTSSRLSIPHQAAEVDLSPNEILLNNRSTNVSLMNKFNRTLSPISDSTNYIEGNINVTETIEETRLNITRPITNNALNSSRSVEVLNTTRPVQEEALNTTKPIPETTLNTTRPIPCEAINTTRPVHGEALNTTRPIHGEALNTTRPIPDEALNATRTIPDEALNMSRSIDSEALNTIRSALHCETLNTTRSISSETFKMTRSLPGEALNMTSSKQDEAPGSIKQIPDKYISTTRPILDMSNTSRPEKESSCSEMERVTENIKTSSVLILSSDQTPISISNDLQDCVPDFTMNPSLAADPENSDIITSIVESNINLLEPQNDDNFNKTENLNYTRELSRSIEVIETHNQDITQNLSGALNLGAEENSGSANLNLTRDCSQITSLADIGQSSSISLNASIAASTVTPNKPKVKNKNKSIKIKPLSNKVFNGQSTSSITSVVGKQVGRTLLIGQHTTNKYLPGRSVTDKSGMTSQINNPQLTNAISGVGVTRHIRTNKGLSSLSMSNNDTVKKMSVTNDVVAKPNTARRSLLPGPQFSVPANKITAPVMTMNRPLVPSQRAISNISGPASRLKPPTVIAKTSVNNQENQTTMFGFKRLSSRLPQPGGFLKK